MIFSGGKLEDYSAVNESLYSCWNARGQYDAMEFVLRLRPDIHRILARSRSGYFRLGEIDQDLCLSFSTLLHETIHWWQFVGSTYGFIYSLAYPAQLFSNSNRYLLFLKEVGKYKSIKKYYETSMKDREACGHLFDEVSVLLNTYFDIEFFKLISFAPNNAHEYVNDKYFESLGHSYRITYEVVRWLISVSCKEDSDLFTVPCEWQSEFIKLRDRKVEGFYYGSPVQLSPVGGLAIFEGQARFSQLVYLYRASRGSCSWDQFRKAGYLSGIYVEAFQVFLTLLDEEWPSEISDPLIGLFLLICDLAINPTEGFLLEVIDYSSFVNSSDPGIRFLMLCTQVREQRPDLKSAIVNHTKEEYVEIGNILNGLIYTYSFEMSHHYYTDILKNGSVVRLMEEERTFKYSKFNMPVRVLFSQFLKFQESKINYPHIFCWPGYCFSNSKEDGVELSLFKNHGALFVDGEDGDVYPQLFEGRDALDVQETFNSFFEWNALFDLTRQWVVGDGDFVLDYSWLTSKHDNVVIDKWAKHLFSDLFRVSLDGFTVL